jgi:hypothetical protein
LITSFGNQATADLFNGINSRNSRKIPSEITQKALNKLDILNAVEKLDELNSTPGDRLEESHIYFYLFCPPPERLRYLQREIETEEPLNGYILFIQSVGH